MFSKALFKQSCKANGLMWGIITFAICFMLACLMLICGGGNLSEIKTSLSDTIIEAEIDSQIDSRTLTYYDMASLSMDKFDETFQEEYKTNYTANLTSGDLETIENAKTLAATSAYQAAALEVYNYSILYAKELGYEEDSSEYNEVLAIMNFAFAATGTEELQAIYTSHDETYPTTTEIIAVVGDDDAKHSLIQNTTAIFIASAMTEDDNIALILEALADYDVDEEKYYSFGFTYDGIKSSANEVIVTYQAQMDYELSLINESDYSSTDKYNEACEEKKEEIRSSLTGSLLSTLPQDVSDGIEEVGKADLFGLVIGSIFYKIAGLLLPFIYIIMVSNNLIAGQVDSGSMAYILSTSTKRKQVTFTQGVFLIASIFVMTLCLTLTSFVCYAIINGSVDTDLNYLKLTYLNLGFFVTLLTISGLCFLTSCWFDRTKKSMSIGGGLTMFFLVATMLGLFGTSVLPSIIRLSSLNFFNYVSLISLFDTYSIIHGSYTFLWKLAIMLGLAIVGYIVGSVRFDKKDLPL